MVGAQQALLSSRNCPEDFQIVVSFVSNDDDTDDDIKPISGTCSSGEWVLSMDIRQELDIEESLADETSTNVVLKLTKLLHRS